MPISFKQPLRHLKLRWFELQPDEIGAISGFGKSQHIRISVEAASDLGAKLRKLGFHHCPDDMSSIIDTVGFGTVDEYLATIATKNRQTIKRGLRDLGDGGIWKIKRWIDFTPEEVAGFQNDLLIPFYTFHGYSLDTMSAKKWLSRADQYRHGDYYVISLEVGGRAVAAMTVKKGPVAKVFDHWSVEPGQYYWHRPMRLDERAVFFHLSAFHPGVGSELAAILPDLLYWKSISWAIDGGCDLLAIGREYRTEFDEQYMGVSAYKAKWRPKAAFFWDRKMRTYKRPCDEAFYWRNQQWMYFRLTEGLVPEAVIYLRSPDIGAEERRILESDQHIKKRVIVADLETAEYLSAELRAIRNVEVFAQGL